MTTAEITDHSGRPIMDGDKPAGVFATRAGHVNPKRAINPGLVYDIRPDEYITHLCTLGYTKSEIFTITHRNVSCHETLLENRGFSINYPSISVMFTPRKMSKVIKRQLTNVGSPNSIYSVEVVEPEGVKVRIKPQRLIFKYTNQQLSYRVWIISRKEITTKIWALLKGIWYGCTLTKVFPGLEALFQWHGHLRSNSSNYGGNNNSSSNVNL